MPYTAPPLQEGQAWVRACRTDLSVHSQAHLNNIARQLNERPRKTLLFETPAEKFSACVAMTG